MSVHFIKSDIWFLLPNVAIKNMRKYYGYNVIYVIIIVLLIMVTMDCVEHV